MSKSKNKVPEYQAAPAPEVPTPPSLLSVGNVTQMPSSPVPYSSTSINGVKKGWSGYDSVTNQFAQGIQQSDEEKKQQLLNNQLLINSLGGANNVIQNLNDPKQREQDYLDLYNPAKSEVERAYNRDTGSAINNAATRGTLNSIGFQNYRTNELDRNYADTLGNLSSNARIQSLQIPGIRLAPYTDAAAMAQSGLDAQTQRELSLLDPSFRGQFMGANTLSQNFLDRLNALKMQNDTLQQNFQNHYNNSSMANNYNQNSYANANAYNLNAYNTNLQNKKGWLSKLF